MAGNATVTSSGNVAVGPIGSDWTAQLDAVPHSPLQSNGSTGQIDFSIPAYDRAHLLMNNSATFNYSDAADSNAERNTVVGGTTYTANNPAFFTSIPGVIDSVNISGASASCTMGTPFTQFATNDTQIPWVGSGATLGALDLVCQLAGNERCSLTNPAGKYWSLIGHDTGFDSNNQVVYAEDHSYYMIDYFYTNQVTRYWDMRNNYSSHSWYTSNMLGGLCSNIGEGSSPTLVPGTRTSVAFKMDVSLVDFHFNYGANAGGYDATRNGFSQQYGFGPYNTSTGGNPGAGKTFSWTITNSTKNLSVYLMYNTGSGTVWTNQQSTTNTSLSALDFTKALKVVTDFSWVSSTSFSLNIWIKAADGTGPTVTYTSGTITSTKIDNYAKPWDHAGNMSGLYQITTSNSFDPSTLLANYENPLPYSWALQNQNGLSVQGAFPTNEPIAPYTGSLWDYISQVCTAKQQDLRIAANGSIYLSDMAIQPTQLVNWAPSVTPSITIDNSNTSSTVEIDAQLMTMNYQPTIYDARTDGNQVYSIAAGQSTTFTITGNFTGSGVYNPCPYYDYASFDAYARYGGFIVSGADDLPILPIQWVAGGGRITVKQTGPSTLEVTVTCPNIVTANADTGNASNASPSYYFGISDGQNQYGAFAVVGSAGSAITQRSFTYQTGASYTAGNTSSGQVTNPCATSMRMVNTLAGWASSIATGPNLQMTTTIPTSEWALFGIGFNMTDYFGQLPGKRLLYRNIAWRVMSATLHSGGIDLTCAADVTYGSNEWNNNWSSKTVDQYTAYWNGCTYDDLNAMPIAGPVNNWSNIGALPPTATALGIAADTRE